MMSTRSTLPMLAVLVMVLLFDTPRTAAQTSYAPPGPPPPPEEALSPSEQTPGPSEETPGPSEEPTETTSQQERGQVWNASRYPATDFRSEATPPMFALWPENLSYVKFEYYCEDALNHKRKLEDFVYKEGEGFLITRPYFDVGLVDEQFTPYFRRWQFWQVDIKRITCDLHCEYSDLQRLYAYRLKRNVLAIGLGYGVAAWVILQVAVIAFTAPLRMCTQPTQQETRNPSASTPPSCCSDSLHTWKSETPWSDCICDWIHLLLLVVIGFAMMEGVGHSDYFRWRSMTLYNTAVVYTYLTLFSMISSFLHQCAYFLTRRIFTAPALPQNTPAAAAPPPPPPPPPAPTAPAAAPPAPPAPPAAAGTKSGISEDWRYQRIFGQFGVLVLMGMYLIGVDDDTGQGMDSLGGIVVAAIVVACIWSAGVSAVVAVRSVRVIFTRLLPRNWTLRAWKWLARKWRAFFDSRIHAAPASPRPVSNVSSARLVAQVSRNKTMPKTM